MNRKSKKKAALLYTIEGDLKTVVEELLPSANADEQRAALMYGCALTR